MDFEQEYGVGQSSSWYSTGGGGSFDWSGLPYAQIGGAFGTILGGGGGGAAKDAAYADASAMLQLAGMNSQKMMQIAGINASATRNVGYANAAVVEGVAYMNGQVMMLEGLEQMRRHLREERYLIGNIRAIQSASGWSINEGTPRIYVEATKAEMEHNREFLALQQEMSLFTMLAEASMTAGLHRYSADQSANAMLMTAQLERDMMLAEASATYDSMIRQADLQYLLYKNKKKSSLFGAIGGLAGAGLGFVISGGNPAGAAAGYQIGSGVGSGIA